MGLAVFRDPGHEASGSCCPRDIQTAVGSHSSTGEEEQISGRRVAKRLEGSSSTQHLGRTRDAGLARLVYPYLLR